MRTNLLLLVSLTVFCICGVCQGGALRKNFYQTSCPKAEETIRNVTWKNVAADSGLVADLLRMHFHDCFVRGCDGSLLLDSADNTAEKDSSPNLTLEGFDVIDEVKTEVEKICPGVVSCADIIALAARDAVSFQFKRSVWDVFTGRRDGRVSLKSEADANIPLPSFNFDTLRQRFAAKGLTVRDLVVLSGAHTIGHGHCKDFSNRLYNFTGKGDADPSLDSTYADSLRSQCQSLSDTTTTVPMDPQSDTTFDNHYFANLMQNKGLFQSDAALLTNPVSQNIVNVLLNSNAFFTEFGIAIQKLGSIGVLTGTAGEIRNKCNAVN